MNKPFFANFLENQVTKNEAIEIKAGSPTIVHGDPCSTMGEFQSNGAVEAHNPNCEPVLVTLKFPSDNDEDGLIA
ncbi:MAG: serine endopeptidase [Bacteroidetes bacterium]|nr:MAG: serine endopeptidase [Bacteroidota bacterium]